MCVCVYVYVCISGKFSKQSQLVDIYMPGIYIYIYIYIYILSN